MDKPKQVKDAQLRADHEALSAMGRKGAESRKLNEDLRKARREEDLRERMAELARTESVEDGEVLPPKPPTDD